MLLKHSSTSEELETHRLLPSAEFVNTELSHRYRSPDVVLTVTGRSALITTSVILSSISRQAENSLALILIGMTLTASEKDLEFSLAVILIIPFNKTYDSLTANMIRAYPFTKNLLKNTKTA